MDGTACALQDYYTTCLVFLDVGASGSNNTWCNRNWACAQANKQVASLMWNYFAFAISTVSDSWKGTTMPECQVRRAAAPFAIAVMCAALATAFTVARSLGWRETLGADSHWLTLTVVAGASLLPSIVLPILVAIRGTSHQLGPRRVIQLSIALLILTGVVNLMLTGGF